MSSGQVEPEQYFLGSAPHVPNSRLPVLVYRNALQDTSPQTILNRVEPNGWIKGGQWKTYKVPHFHTQCHECYGIIRGGSTYVLGVGPKDPESDSQGRPYGMTLSVQRGDVFVLPVSEPSNDSRRVVVRLSDTPLTGRNMPCVCGVVG